MQPKSNRLCALQANSTCRVTVCDVSPTAIEALQQLLVQEDINPSRVHAFAHDATHVSTADAAAPDLVGSASTSGPAPAVRLLDLNADMCLLVFTLSAVPPVDMSALLKVASAALRPGGELLVRDYGLYDMAQLRFPPRQKLGERLYHRFRGLGASVGIRDGTEGAGYG